MGDRDGFRPGHSVEIYRLLPEGQFASLPGGDHFFIWTRPDWLLPMLTAFLDAPLR